eukprot:NODE_6681_length_826_cov_153.762447_g6445_i0.p1 GENE.NODE_6681_length_826_cov_153.762447_g6445_i0~~NODE_6681_length_826_cov_153.762447_g6445_i0.p1  ORF type:complete len:213 (-),score=39.14 NODE_6681_length_826_cov_153.762447_g6445_i0:116-754(-)
MPTATERGTVNFTKKSAPKPEEEEQEEEATKVKKTGGAARNLPIPTPSKPPVPLGTKCEHCKKQFTSTKAAAAHVYGKHGIVCPVVDCGKSFMMEQNYRDHFLSKHLKPKDEDEAMEEDVKPKFGRSKLRKGKIWLPSWKHHQRKTNQAKRSRRKPPRDSGLKVGSKRKREVELGGIMGEIEGPKKKKRRVTPTAPNKLEGQERTRVNYESR